MNRPRFYNDIDVLSDDINQIGSHSSEEFKKTFLAFLASSGGFGDPPFGGSTTSGGVIGSPADYLQNFKNLRVVKIENSTNQIAIWEGNALDNSGNLIYNPNTLLITAGDNTINTKWSPVSGINYVSIQYQEISGSLKSDLTGNLYPTRFSSSYLITVGNIPSGDSIRLASFYTDISGNILSSITDLRQYVRLNVTASSVILNPTPTFKKSPTSHTNVEDHVNAVGTGPVSILNPHGLSLTDLGYTDTSIAALNSHLINAHLNGILVINPGSASAWNSFKGSVNNPTSNAYLSFQPPVGAILVVNGNIISTGLGTLYSSTAPSDGNFWAVCDASGSLSWKSSTFFTAEELNVGVITRTNHKASQYYILGLATITDTKDDISVFVDHRGFYSFTTSDIAADVEVQKDPYVAGNTQYGSSSLSLSLARIRHQIARAIGGTGGSWETGTYKLTDGITSNADLLHAHNFNALTDVLTNPNLTVVNLGVLTAGSGSNANYLHSHPFQGSVFIANTSQTFLSNGIGEDVNWLKGTGSDYTYDYLNIMSGSSGSIFSLSAGVYSLSAMYTVFPNTLTSGTFRPNLRLFEGANLITSAYITSPHTSIYTAVSTLVFSTSFKLLSLQNIKMVFLFEDVNMTPVGVTSGRLFITRLPS